MTLSGMSVQKHQSRGACEWEKKESEGSIGEDVVGVKPSLMTFYFSFFFTFD